MVQKSRKSVSDRQSHEKYCHSCGRLIIKEAEICPKCGVRQGKAGFAYNVSYNVGGGMSDNISKGKPDKIVAALLAIFLGSFGAHKFYLGETGLGVLYLCFFWTMIPTIIGIVEGIIYLTKSDEEFEARYARKK